MEETLKVLILCNNAFVKGNGLCTAIQATVKRLRDAGVDARLMAAVNADSDGAQPDFPLEHFKFPLFEPIIYANGFRYAKTDGKRMEEAISWADVVHIEEAFPLEIKAANIAGKLGKPVVGTFHLFPENITANLRIAKLTPVSNLILYAWRDWVFNKCSYIQCPTDLVRQHLENHHFKSKLLKKGIVSHEPRFGFYDKEELARLSSEAYLYIHCAWVEVEGLSCVEALREGIVPVIAKGRLTATSQFALDERSIFPVFDAKALAEKIDWWIEHREEHDRMRKLYAESVKNTTRPFLRQN